MSAVKVYEQQVDGTTRWLIVVGDPAAPAFSAGWFEDEHACLQMAEALGPACDCPIEIIGGPE